MKPSLLKLFILLLSITVSNSSIGQLPDLIPYRKGDLWGYCDSNKVVKIKPIFNKVEWFDELGKAKVKHISQTDSLEDRFIDSEGNFIPKGYGNMAHKFYYKIEGDSIWLINKATKKENKYPYLLKQRGNSIHQEVIAYIDGKTTYIYTVDGSHQALKLRGIKNIIRFITEKEIQFSQKSHYKTSLGEGLVYQTHKGDTLIKFYNSKKPIKVEGLYRYVSLLTAGNTFIINNSKSEEAKVFDLKGELLFTIKTKHGLSHFGKNFFATYSYTEGRKNYLANIINAQGEYVKKEIPLSDEDVYRGFYKSTLYRQNDSCFLYQDTNGQTHTLCSNTGKMKILRLKSNFIVFQTFDTTLCLYNSEGQLLLENWKEPYFEYHERSIKYPVIGEEYFPLTINGQKVVMDKTGKIIVIHGGYNDLMHVGSFFLMANMDGITLIDSTGKLLKHYLFYDYTPMSTYPQYGLVSGIHNILRSPRSNIIIPLETPRNGKYGYFPIDTSIFQDSSVAYYYPVLLQIEGNTYKEIKAKEVFDRLHIADSMHNWAVRIEPFDEAGQFYNIFITREGKFETYCYMDKYGTAYCDE